MTAHIFPPRPSDQRIKDLIAIHSVTTTGAIGDDVREAMAIAMGETSAWALTYSVDDVWLAFKEFMGITDTSEPEFGDNDLLAGILMEDGGNILKEDGAAIIQE